MSGLFRVLYWVFSVLVVLFFVGLAIKIAKGLIFVAVLAGLGAVLYALFGKPGTFLPPSSGS